MSLTLSLGVGWSLLLDRLFTLLLLATSRLVGACQRYAIGVAILTLFIALGVERLGLRLVTLLIGGTIFRRALLHLLRHIASRRELSGLLAGSSLSRSLALSLT